MNNFFLVLSISQCTWNIFILKIGHPVLYLTTLPQTLFLSLCFLLYTVIPSLFLGPVALEALDPLPKETPYRMCTHSFTSLGAHKPTDPASGIPRQDELWC